MIVYTARFVSIDSDSEHSPRNSQFSNLPAICNVRFNFACLCSFLKLLLIINHLVTCKFCFTLPQCMCAQVFLAQHSVPILNHNYACSNATDCCYCAQRKKDMYNVLQTHILGSISLGFFCLVDIQLGCRRRSNDTSEWKQFLLFQ